MIILLSLLVLNACTSTGSDNRVHIAHAIDLLLQIPASTGTQLQKIDAQYKGERHALLMQVQTRDGMIDMAGLTMTGTRLFSLSFDGEQISSWQSPLFTAPFDGAYVLADHQLATLPAAALRSALPAAVRIEEENLADGNRVRRLFNSKAEVVIEVTYRADSSVRYCHRERDYCLDITPINAAQ